MDMIRQYGQNFDSVDNMDVIWQYRHYWTPWTIYYGHYWTIWTLLDNVDIIGQYGHYWTIWTFMDIIGQYGQYGHYWTKRPKLNKIKRTIRSVEPRCNQWSRLKKSEAIILFSLTLYDGVIACCQNMNDREK